MAYQKEDHLLPDCSNCGKLKEKKKDWKGKLWIRGTTVFSNGIFTEKSYIMQRYK